MSPGERHRAPLIFWPFAALWDLLAFLLSLIGRVAAALVGLALVALGIVLTLTVIGGIIGIPLMVLGFLLLVRSLF